MEVKQFKPGLTTQITRRQVNPLDFRKDDISIDDIAHALSQVNRFGGHAKAPISVAQHCVYVSRLVEGSLTEWNYDLESPNSKKMILQGLLHDASEAYLGDMVKWVKETPEMAAFRKLEAKIERMIYVHFGCHPTMLKVVEEADRLMVRFEGLYNYGHHWHTFQRPGYARPTSEERDRIGPWKPWHWKAARESFLQRFNELTREEF